MIFFWMGYFLDETWVQTKKDLPLLSFVNIFWKITKMVLFVRQIHLIMSMENFP